MQYNQTFYRNAFPNISDPFYPYRTFQSINSDIIGEGDLISVIFPDGNLHFYFLPTNNRETFQNNNNVHFGAYYVRSVSQPISAAVFFQQYPNIYGVSHPGSYLITENKPSGFQLKFHNDSWTSTTDLHYFFTRLRGTQWHPSMQPKECEVVPMEISTEDSSTHQQTGPTKPYLYKCEHNDNRITDVIKANCSCGNLANSCSNISNRTHDSKVSFLKHRKRQNRKNKRSCSNECKCHQVSAAKDESVTTCVDQATNCASEESNTQTCPLRREISIEVDENSISNNSRVKSQRPKNLRKKKLTERIPTKNHVNFEETDCSSDSCCCSDVGFTYTTDNSSKCK